MIKFYYNQMFSQIMQRFRNVAIKSAKLPMLHRLPHFTQNFGNQTSSPFMFSSQTRILFSNQPPNYWNDVILKSENSSGQNQNNANLPNGFDNSPPPSGDNNNDPNKNDNESENDKQEKPTKNSDLAVTENEEIVSPTRSKPAFTENSSIREISEVLELMGPDADIKGVRMDPREGNYLMMYTCGVCETRQNRSFTKKSYHEGVVIVRCEGCQNLHLIADNMKFFEDEKGWHALF